MACRRHALPSHRQCDGVAHTAFVGDATKFAENYSLKSAGENACVAGSPGCESRAIPLCHSACYGACQASTCSTGSLASTCGSERSIRRVGQGGRRPAGAGRSSAYNARCIGAASSGYRLRGRPAWWRGLFELIERPSATRFLFLSGAPWRWRTALHKSVGRVYIMNMHPPAPSPPDRNDKTERAREKAQSQTTRTASPENTRLPTKTLACATCLHPVLLRVVPREEEGFGRFQKVGRPTLLGGAAAAA